MKCLLVYNPVSGNSYKLIKKLPYISKELSKAYEVVDIRPTKYAKEIITIAKESCKKYDTFIVAGGDGSFQEALNGLANCKNAPTLAYIPCGSCCDIANNHNISKNIKKAVKIILRNKKEKIDLTKINDEYLSYVAGIGTYTAGVFNASSKLKKKFKRLGYVFSAFKESFSVKPLHVSISVGKKVYMYNDAILVLILNTKSVAGFKYFNYKAKLDDGKIDVLVIKQDVFNTPFNIWKLFIMGVENLKNHPNVRFFTGSDIKVSCLDDVIWNVDGEKSKFKNDIHVVSLKKKITMIVGGK